MVAYYRSDDTALRFTRANDPIGTTWQPPIELTTYPDERGFETRDISLKEVNGRPAIAFYNAGPNDLNFIRANDSDGSTWGGIQTLDSTGNVGMYPSLNIVNGAPAIAYEDGSGDKLKFIRAMDLDGATWGTPIAVDSARGSWNSLVIVDGLPAIASYQASTTSLQYYRSTDSNGSNWGAPIVVDSAGDVGKHAFMSVVNGYPIIAYFDETDDNLRWSHANDKIGASWSQGADLARQGDVGRYISIVPLGNSAGIIHRDSYNGDIDLFRVNGLDGAINWIAVQP